MNDKLEMLNDLYRNETMKQAEEARIANELKKQTENPETPFYGPVMVQLGNVMINMGNKLHSHYDGIKEDAALKSKRANTNGIRSGVI
ncbi:hypothetical protein MASR2M15_14090 [Anaerolineales bacterium]